MGFSEINTGKQRHNRDGVSMGVTSWSGQLMVTFTLPGTLLEQIGADTKVKISIGTDANADLIVCAVNNFNNLLAACKYALEYTIANGDAHNKLRTAIAKAEWRTP